ncbi:Uncharacterised protein [Chryseobacterium gleum]|uniref:Uncharacterized protein n=3 Tax=Chryseobacterium gleum TaxID=250 RepID=A0A448B828_CHRGE|nr:hypothetical protein HMPREF0204_11369 [Chryseobacterium gleum ATCC 35910]VEE10713.1 Uncharacterised protein [Chryseobacterium gleum]
MSVILNKYLNFIKMKKQIKTNLDQFIKQNNLTKKSNRVINPESLLKKIQMANKFTINNINAGRITKKEIEDLDKAYKDIMNNYL